MEQGVSGYFDLAGSENFTGRFFYSEEYDKVTGKRLVSITGISIQSTVYGGTWYPGGTVSVNGQALQTMVYEGKTTHMVTAGASEAWYEVKAIELWGLYFPWTSEEIESNADGSCQATIDVDIKLWRNSSSPTITIQGSQVIELTKVNLGPRAFVRRNGAYAEVLPRLRHGGAWVEPRGKIGG